MTDLNQRLSAFIATREKATPGEWFNEDFAITASDGAVIADVCSLDTLPCIGEDNSPEQLELLKVEFSANASLIVAAANDAVPLLLACQEKIRELELQRDCELGVRAMTVARLGGTVEGRPTHTGNFLQRIDELREAERILRELAYEPHACGSNGAVIAQSYFEAKDQE